MVQERLLCISYYELRWNIQIIAVIIVTLNVRPASSWMQILLPCSEWAFIYNASATNSVHLWDNPKNTDSCLIHARANRKAVVQTCGTLRSTDDSWDRRQTNRYLHCCCTVAVATSKETCNREKGKQLTLWSTESRTWGGSGWQQCPGRWGPGVLWGSWGSSSEQWCKAPWPPPPASCRQTLLASRERWCARRIRGRSWLF